MSTENQDTELVVQQDSTAVQVTLNRPQALNALSLEMIRILSAGLESWAQDERINAVFVKGAGGRAFCAGGDVKQTYKTGMAFRRGSASEHVISLFFGEEYCLNRALFHFPKPIFAFMDGITMGGGFGVAGPCRYRIASENTVFAMPETAIGFFPDVGSTYFLNRCPGEAGAYLALTGNSIGPADMLACGLATHYVPSSRHGDCRAALERAFEEGGADIEKTLAAFHQPPPAPATLTEKAAIIDKCFAPGKSAEDIIAALQGSGDEWGRAQAEILMTRSPTSLKVTLAHLRRAASMDFDAITAEDFTLAQHFLQGHDFYEGVRAVLIDKDKQPGWDPQTLEGVSKLAVEDYFRPARLLLDEIAA